MTIDPKISPTQAYETSRAQHSTASLIQKSRSKDSQELRKASEDFEAIFVKMMLDSMRKTLSEESLIPKNAAEKLFEDQLYDEYATTMSKTAHLGLAEMIYEQMEGSLPGALIDLK